MILKTPYIRWLITARRRRSSPRQALSTIKYRNRLRPKRITLSGSGLTRQKPNSAVQQQKPPLCQISKNVSPRLTCLNSKYKWTLTPTVRRRGRCYSQPATALGRTRLSKTKSTGLPLLKQLWGCNKTVAFQPSCRQCNNITTSRYQSRQSTSLPPQGRVSRTSLTRR